MSKAQQPKDGGVYEPSIPQNTSAKHTNSQHEKPISNDASHLPEWQQPLSKRGILEQALKAGWYEHELHGKPGWGIPLHNENGERWTLPDGTLAQRWKYAGNQADVDRYCWGYGKKGSAKPEGCDFYHVPYVNLREAINANDHTLIVACGEPDMLTFLAAGMPHVTSFFGEKNIPDNAVEKFRQWGVQTIHYYPDRDKTGGEAAEALAIQLRDTGIALCIYELPADDMGQPIKDINDLYRAIGCDPRVFREYLGKLPVHNMGDSLPSAGKKRQKAPTAKKDLPPEFYQAIEEALGIKGYKPDGWSKQVVCPFRGHEHDDTRPSASYHQHMHILHCFKCGHSWLAIEVGAVLGLDWRDYIKSATKARATKPNNLETEIPVDEEVLSEAKGAKLPLPTDDEFGETLMVAWDGNVAYFHDQWHQYQGGYWKVVSDLSIQSMIWDTLIAQKKRGVRPNDSRAHSVKAYLLAKLTISPEQIDNGDQYVNLRNGLLNLETGLLEGHRCELYLTSQLSFAYEPEADCPIWKRSLAQWMTTDKGQPDPELIALLQEAFGYSLTTDTSLEKAFWLYGPAGSGKSTVLKMLAELGGNSQISLDLSSLDRNPSQLADLPGKRIVTCTEARAGSTLADNNLKTLISGEEMVARRLYSQNFCFKPQAKVWWAMNERPANRDSSDAIYRRLVTIPFGNSFPPDKQNRDLFKQLQAELPGIFNWAMEGLSRLLTDGHFTTSKQAEQSLDEYRLENDLERNFVQDSEWCILDGSQQTKSGDLYLAYKAWYQRFGDPFPKSQVKVARDWERLGLTKHKNGSVYYSGIGLKPEARLAASRLK